MAEQSHELLRLGAVIALAGIACTSQGHGSVSAPSHPPAEPLPATKPWPETRTEPVVETLHGIEIVDPYRWLESDDPEVERWVEQQDAYARRALEATPGREALRSRLRELEYIDEVSAPERRGPRYFFSQRHKHKEKRVYYWREGETGTPRVLVDPATLGEHVSVHGVRPSYDGRFAAFRISEANQDESTISVMEVETGRMLDADRIPGIRYVDAAWEHGAAAFYYTRLPTDDSIPAEERAGRAKIYRHEVGRPYAGDEVVFDETGNPKTVIGPDVSDDGAFLFVYVVHGSASTDVYFKSLRAKDSAIRPLFVGQPARFFANAWQGKIYARTNHQAARWRLIRIDDPRKPDEWKEIAREAPDAVLDSVSIVGGHLSLQYQQHASTAIQVVDLDGRSLRAVSTPGIGLAEGLQGRPEDDTAYYSFSSFLRPPTVYRTSVTKGHPEVFSEVELPADPDQYPLRQVFYPSKDGTRIPMFILEPRGFEPGNATPFILTGYGGFGKSVLPHFNASFYPWLEAGGGIAIANLRGGGEYGEAWHRAGMGQQKQTVFDDFIAAAEYLTNHGYTRSGQLAITGGSNGGLLVAAAMTQRPELFGAVVCHSPLLDMVRFHRFGIAGIWTSEYGSVEDPAEFQALYDYSPYHHVRSGVRYPSLLLTAADHDDRVAPLHARKFAAAMQAVGDGKTPVLLRIERQAGHAGSDLVRQRIDAKVDELSFLFSALGMSPGSRK